MAASICQHPSDDNKIMQSFEFSSELGHQKFFSRNVLCPSR
jgi:hypothetical protein